MIKRRSAQLNLSGFRLVERTGIEQLKDSEKTVRTRFSAWKKMSPIIEENFRNQTPDECARFMPSNARELNHRGNEKWMADLLAESE